jgi:formylglycine-generating enzyme required for sulfatase activity
MKRLSATSFAVAAIAGWLCVFGMRGSVNAEEPQTITNSIGMKLVQIPAGEFVMGRPEEVREFNEKPARSMRINQSFYLGQTEVTQSQFRRVMNASPWSSQYLVKEGPTVAASYVSWNDAVAFCSKLTQMERRAGRLGRREVYRLPTEAEWEYACRAGSTRKFSFGDDESLLDAHAWHKSASVGPKDRLMSAQEVARKKPNGWGLYDMHGNVGEWCSDWIRYEDWYGSQPPTPSMAKIRINRGGDWSSSPVQCGASNYHAKPSAFRSLNFGFRVVLASQ